MAMAAAASTCSVLFGHLSHLLQFYPHSTVSVSQRCYDSVQKTLHFQTPEHAAVALSPRLRSPKSLHTLAMLSAGSAMFPTNVFLANGSAATFLVEASKDWAAEEGAIDLVGVLGHAQELEFHRIIRFKEELSLRRISNPGAPTGENLLSDHRGVKFNIVTVKSSGSFPAKKAFKSTEELAAVTGRTFEVTMLEALQVSMNFTLSASIVSRWVSLDRTAQVYRDNGQVSALLQGKADFALAALQEPSLPNEPRIQFNMPIDTMKLLVMFRKPEMARDALAQARPFVENLWIAILLWIVTNAVVLSILKLVSVWVVQLTLDLIRGKVAQRSRKRSCASVSFSTLATDSIFWPLSLICCVGVEDMPEQNSLRMAVFTAGATAALINMAYGAELLTFLTVEINPYDSVEQLVKTSYRFATYDSPITDNLFKHSPYPAMTKMYERVERSEYYRTSDAKEDLLRGSYGFVTNDLHAHEYLHDNETSQTEVCDLTEVYLPLEDIKLSQYVRTGSPYKRIMDYQILKAKQYGLNSVWNKRDRFNRPPCLQLVNFDAIPIRSVSLGFFILCAGAGLTLIVLVLEKLCAREVHFYSDLAAAQVIIMEHA